MAVDQRTFVLAVECGAEPAAAAEVLGYPLDAIAVALKLPTPPPPGPTKEQAARRLALLDADPGRVSA